MESVTVAKAYAKALFEVALTDKQIDAYKEALVNSTAIIQNEKFQEVLSVPAFDRAEKISIICQGCDKKIVDKFSNFISLLTENNRLSVIPIVLDLFNQMELQNNKIHLATIHTAKEISDTQKKTLKESLEKKYDGQVQINYVFDSSLISGAVIQMDDDTVYNGSINNRINKLESILVE